MGVETRPDSNVRGQVSHLRVSRRIDPCVSEYRYEITDDPSKLAHMIKSLAYVYTTLGMPFLKHKRNRLPMQILLYQVKPKGPLRDPH